MLFHVLPLSLSLLSVYSFSLININQPPKQKKKRRNRSRLNKKMASFNFVLVITLLLSLNHSCDAYSAKGFKNAAAEERNYEVDRLGGRKFMLDKSQWRRRLKVKKDEEIISTSSRSGASSVGNSKQNTTLMKKREMKMEKIMSSTVINHQYDDQTKNINPSGFMALNADYHMARPHPPRNN